MNISFCLVLTRRVIYVSKEAVGLGFALHAGLKVILNKPRASLCLLELLSSSPDTTEAICEII